MESGCPAWPANALSLAQTLPQRIEVRFKVVQVIEQRDRETWRVRAAYRLGC